MVGENKYSAASLEGCRETKNEVNSFSVAIQLVGRNNKVFWIRKIRKKQSDDRTHPEIIHSLALESEGFTRKSPKAGRGYPAVIEIYYPSAPTWCVTMNSDASLEPGSCLSLEPQLVDG